MLCQAINAHPPHVVTFYYSGDDTPGYRTVEPHMIAYNPANHLALSAWFLVGATESGQPGWKEYLLESVSNVAITELVFSGPRPGYKPDGGKRFHQILCAL